MWQWIWLVGFNQIINKYSNYIFIIGNISIFKLNVVKYHLIKNNTSHKLSNLPKDQAWWMRLGTWLHGLGNARFFGCNIYIYIYIYIYIQKPKKKKKKKKKNSVEVRYFLHNVLSNFNSTTMESTLAKKKREICLVNDTSDCC